MMNICMIGHGMMGAWHSLALADTNCVLHTVVGRRETATSAFAQQHGYRHWTTNSADAFADPSIDVVIVANPSELHAETAIASLQAGKHTFIEIPIAMNLKDAQSVAQVAKKSKRIVGVCHPMRFRPERAPMRARFATGEESLRQVVGRFYIHRLKNVGATGYSRSWIDNILWHHTTHLLDLGLWLADGATIRNISWSMPGPDEQTGIPMEVALIVETTKDQSIICTGSYYARERLYDTLVVTSADSYRLDVLGATLTTAEGTAPILSEQDNCALATLDFVEAVAANRAPRVTCDDVLPTMQILQQVQDEWDKRHDSPSIPGRP